MKGEGWLCSTTLEVQPTKIYKAMLRRMINRHKTQRYSRSGGPSKWYLADNELQECRARTSCCTNFSGGNRLKDGYLFGDKGRIATALGSLVSANWMTNCRSIMTLRYRTGVEQRKKEALFHTIQLGDRTKSLSTSAVTFHVPTYYCEHKVSFKAVPISSHHNLYPC